MRKDLNMNYSKPKLINKNHKTGNYSAGCPNKDQLILGIRPCERADL